jgi:histidyl-tRNA synthetase
MKTIIQSVKGTRDFYPEQMALRNWLYSKMRKVSELYGYQEYDGPFIEKIDLYAAKSGEELVKEQAFVFSDRGGDLITLRPELTLSLARMVAQKQGELVFPLRWWSFGPFWRYERPQKGRTREFFQWNIDLIGGNSPEADAELIAICALFFKETGLSPDKVKIKVNDRRIMDTILSGLGFEIEQRPMVLGLIDRRDKLQPAAWDSFALEQGVTPTQLDGLKIVLADSNLWKTSTELSRVFSALERMGVREYIEYDAGTIRGLLYYTGTVFEAQDLDGGRAILGGGRYDNLVGDVGGEPVGGVGFAMGDVMIGIVLEKYGCIPPFSLNPSQVLVTVFDDSLLQLAFEIGAELRNENIRVAVYPEAAKLPKQFKYADKIGARLAIVVGPDEQANNQVTIKDLAGRTQRTISRSGLIWAVKELLAQNE